MGFTLPAPARAIAAATLDAVAAARAQDAERFDEATARLAAAEPERVRVALGGVVRLLLEDVHPDGLSGDDLVELIKACARRAFGWSAEVDVQALVVVVTGALGVQEPDEAPRRFTPAEVARHASLFVAELLAAPAPRPLPAYVEQAFAEIATGELNEMP
jgi:hypothetical protein